MFGLANMGQSWSTRKRSMMSISVSLLQPLKSAGIWGAQPRWPVGNPLTTKVRSCDGAVCGRSFSSLRGHRRRTNVDNLSNIQGKKRAQQARHSIRPFACTACLDPRLVDGVSFCSNVAAQRLKSPDGVMIPVQQVCDSGSSSLSKLCVT